MMDRPRRRRACADVLVAKVARQGLPGMAKSLVPARPPARVGRGDDLLAGVLADRAGALVWDCPPSPACRGADRRQGPWCTPGRLAARGVSWRLWEGCREPNQEV